jgi:Uma2 family endonuclease
MSTAVATEPRTYSPEDLLAMPDSKSYELVDGRLVERKMGAESSLIGTRLCSRLDLFSQGKTLGLVWGADNGYQCFRHAPRRVRKPDVSFIRSGRLPGDAPPEGWIRIEPDLAVEVISPGDTAEALEEKLDDYRKAGVPLLWVIYPKARKARVFRREGQATELGEDGVLSGEDVLPGFACPLREILPPKPESTEPAATEPARQGPA